jgi:hypothetical protein
MRRINMFNKFLLIPIACMSLTMANTAKAGLGWSFADCQNHYGNALHERPTSEYGRQKYLFRTTDYNIAVWLFNDTVSCIRYQRVDGVAISPIEIGTLLQVNAPKADWSAESEKDNAGLYWWFGQVSRDPFAYEAEYMQDDTVGIFTRADSEMIKMQKEEQRKNL